MAGESGSRLVDGLYGYSEKRLEKALRSVESAHDIPREDREAIVRFCLDCLAEGLSRARVVKYAFTLKTLARMLGKGFRDAGKEDLKGLVARIELSRYSPWTKRDFKVALRKFYRWLGRPEEVGWLKVGVKGWRRLMPEEILTEEEVWRLVGAAGNPRDRALVAVLYESGCRIGELLSLRIRHVGFDGYGAVLLVDGKTGRRRVRIVMSAPYLAEWVNWHPMGDVPDAPLWVNRRGRPLGYAGVRCMLRRLARKAGVRKRVNPHNFRHSRATHLATRLTEAQMKEFFGWVQSSDMASVYVHLSGRDVDNAILGIYGITPEGDKKQNSMAPTRCLSCGLLNPPTNRVCSGCGARLNAPATTVSQAVLERLLEDEEVRATIARKLGELLPWGGCA